MNTKEVINKHIKGYIDEAEELPTESILHSIYAAKVAALADLRKDLEQLNQCKQMKD